MDEKELPYPPQTEPGSDETSTPGSPTQDDSFAAPADMQTPDDLTESPPVPETGTEGESSPPEPDMPEDPLISPKSGNRRIGILLGITVFLLLALGGTVWYFFLRPQPTAPSARPTPTPTRTAIAVTSPTPATQSETHLECRFGLCVEVPGPGEDLCQSSFDCEQEAVTPSGPTQAPTATAAPEPTQEATAIPTQTDVGAPEPTNTPTPSPTTTPSPVPTTIPTSTLTPTPIVSQLPDSGTASTTFAFTLLTLLTLGAGWTLTTRRIRI